MIEIIGCTVWECQYKSAVREISIFTYVYTSINMQISHKYHIIMVIWNYHANTDLCWQFQVQFAIMISVFHKEQWRILTGNYSTFDRFKPYIRIAYNRIFTNSDIIPLLFQGLLYEFWLMLHSHMEACYFKHNLDLLHKYSKHISEHEHDSLNKMFGRNI